MHVSLNEIETMGKRAARGVGLPWGLAEEAGKAARWLTVRGLDGVEPLADILARHDDRDYADLAPAAVDSVWKARSGSLCPLIAGAALCDRAAEIAGGRSFELGETAHPLLLAPFAAGAAELTGVAIDLAWDDVVITLSAKGESIEGNQSALAASSAAGVRCQRVDQIQGPGAMIGQSIRIPPVPATAWSRLAAFAQRTYAPATEASRLSGAGAGLTDNN